MDPTSYKNLHQLLHQMTHSPHGRSIIVHFISFPFIFFFLLILFFLISLKLLSNKNPEIKNLPPSPPQLPIIGNLHQLGNLPHRSMASLSEKYGPLMLLKLGRTPTLIVSSSKLAKEVMKSHDNIFSSRSQNTAAKCLLYGCRDLAFASYGEHWRQAKKLCVLELLSPKRVEYFQYIREEEVENLLKRIGSESCGVINLNQLFVSTSNHIVGRCVLGENYKEEKDGFGEVTRKDMVLLTRFCVGDAFPWFGWIDVLSGFRGELKACFETLDKLFEKVIEERREKLKIGDDNNGCCDEKDFVGIILKLQQQDALHYHFTMEDFKAILLVLFLFLSYHATDYNN